MNINDAIKEQMVSFIKTQEPQMLNLLESLVNIPTPSHAPEGLKRVATLISPFLKELGFEVEEHNCHLLGRKKGSGPPALLLAHMDTVFDAKESRPFSIEGPLARGTGVIDCKGGIVVLLYSLKALHFVGEGFDDLNAVVIINGDEEKGSPTSRALIEDEGEKAQACFSFEAGIRMDNATSIIRERRGIGRFSLMIHGLSAHSGLSHQRGISAMKEMAYKCLAILALTDYERGLTTNVGSLEVRPGKRNIIPDFARAEGEFRYRCKGDGERLLLQLEAITKRSYVWNESLQMGTESTLEAILDCRPSMPETEGSRRLLQLIMETGRQLGLNLFLESRGSASDSNFVSALGVPTVDGLGPVGEKAHTSEEYVEIATLKERATLASLSIYRWLREREG